MQRITRSKSRGESRLFIGENRPALRLAGGDDVFGIPPGGINAYIGHNTVSVRRAVKNPGRL